MKKIGFVDFYISEWHANKYVGWFEQANEALGTDYKVCYAWAEVDVSPMDNVSTDAWCEKMGVQRCDTIEELCQKSDCIVVLAPSNPETHLAYAREVLKHKKPTYIDKTFAPDYETAKEIFRIAQTHDCRFFTTSALRYASELKDYENAKNMIITSGGGNFAEYLIHSVEMAAILLNSPARKVRTESIGNQRICRIVTEDCNEAAIIYSPCFGFSITAQKPNGVYQKTDVTSSFFMNLISEIMKFFETGNVRFDGEQTLEVMKIRTGLLKSESAGGNWITL